MQKFFKYFNSAVIDPQIWVALNFTFLCWYFQLINGWDRPDLLWISFFATLLTYNLANCELGKYLNNRIFIMTFSLLPLLYFAWFSLDMLTVVILAILAVISIWYSVVVKNINLRNLPGLKIFWIALVWSMVVILPWFENFAVHWFVILLQFIAVFCFTVAITIPFDIRDLSQDDKRILTLPQKFGIEGSVRLSTQLLMLSAAFFLTAFQFELTPVTYAFLINVLMAILFCRRMLKKQNKWFTVFWIEGLSGLFLIIYLFLI